MARRPLARTYRPQRFAEMLGQEAPVRALSRAAAQGDLAAAYIFSGTRGIGKTTIARIFAKTLNCENGPAGDCCDTCTPCREVAEGRCLDVLEMDAATHTGIDDVRELREAAQYPPSRDRKRVFILDEAHQLSQSAWNGLLKVLEEPPAWCVFLFCTTEPHKIPPTIESRALHFAFRSPTAAQIRTHLASIAQREAIEVDGEALELLARAADGSVRDGLSALDQVRALTPGAIDAAAVREALGLIAGESVERYVDALVAGDAGAALAVVADLDEQGQDLRAFAGEALDRVRRRAVERALGNAPGAPVEHLVWIGRVLDETEGRLRTGSSPRVLLDLATVRMARMAGLTDLAELATRLAAGVPQPRGPAPAAAPAYVTPLPQATAARPAPPPADDGAPAPAILADGSLARLIPAVQALRAPLAAYLAHAASAELDERGVLVIVLPPEGAKGIWKERLEQPAARDVLAQAWAQVTGRAPAAVEVRSSDSAPVEKRPRMSRDEALGAARQDPFVRSLFDKFGAVVVDGGPLETE